MRIKFSNDEILILKQNPCVFNCTERSVNYTFEFKKRALELHTQGVSAKEIWRRSGFDISKWKSFYFRCTLRDWKKIVQKSGVEGLQKTGGIQFDPGPGESKRDQIKRLELQIKYLKAENDFLAKLRAKRAEPNSGQTRSIQSLEN